MVSVIIPVFNGEKYIQTILSDFEKQTDRDFEIIFINDGSSDKSFEVLEKVKITSHLNINIINQKNAGVSAARNTGIAASKGVFLCFVDVDDQISEHYVSDMHTVIKSHNVDLVICEFQTIKNQDSNIHADRGTGLITVKSSLECLNDFLYGTLITGCWSMMIRKSVIISNNIEFAEGYKYSEDLHFMWRVLAFSKRVAYLDRQLYFYKLQENSAMSKFNSERLQGYQLMQELEGFFEIHVPLFAKEYKKYASAKIMWSIAWQAAVNFDLKQFISFVKVYRIREEMKKLLTFKKKKVRFSAIFFLISPYIFRKMAIKAGKKYIH